MAWAGSRRDVKGEKMYERISHTPKYGTSCSCPNFVLYARAQEWAKAKQLSPPLTCRGYGG